MKLHYTYNKKFIRLMWTKHTGRMLILFIISLIFKSFDLTFQHSSVSESRWWVFSFVFAAFGVLVWRGAELIVNTLQRNPFKPLNNRKLYITITLLVIYGIAASVAFGFVYGITDVLLYGRYEAWDSFTAVSYDLLFGTFVFYMMILSVSGIIHYYKQWKDNQLQTERLMRENMQAKYEALRNQIDPHFFFNSLSVLTNLVYKDADTAADYITQLAKTYRYILDKKFEKLVPVQTELDFLESYLFLIEIRHGESVQVETEIDADVKANGLIPPAAIQMLFENAIKHNRFSLADPLVISVKEEGNWLIIKNKLRKKEHYEPSSGIGLENIRKRYELVGAQSIEVTEVGSEFIVKIPIIR